MADQSREGQQHQSLMRSVLLADASVENISELWRQMMAYQTFAEAQLSEARSRRARAELARREAELDAANATKIFCEKMKAEAQRQLQEAERIRAEAAQVQEHATSDRKRAAEEKAKAEKARERTVSEAQQKAQEILQEARLKTQRECTDLRRKALEEVKSILTHVETIRAAADEELQAKRISAGSTELKAISDSLLALDLEGDGRGTDENGSGPVQGGSPPGAQDLVSSESSQVLDPPADSGSNGTSPVDEPQSPPSRVRKTPGSRRGSKKSASKS